MKTREERKYAVVQEVLSVAKENKCHEFSIVDENGYQDILEKHNIQLSTLRRYLNEEGWKTKLVDFAD